MLGPVEENETSPPELHLELVRSWVMLELKMNNIFLVWQVNTQLNRFFLKSSILFFHLLRILDLMFLLFTHRLNHFLWFFGCVRLLLWLFLLSGCEGWLSFLSLLWFTGFFTTIRVSCPLIITVDFLVFCYAFTFRRTSRFIDAFIDDFVLFSYLRCFLTQFVLINNFFIFCICVRFLYGQPI